MPLFLGRMSECAREVALEGCTYKESLIGGGFGVDPLIVKLGIGNKRKKLVGTRGRSYLGALRESLFIGKRQGHFQNEKLSVGLVKSDRAENPITHAIG